MKRPRALDAMIMRFDRLSLRERLLIFGALLAGVITAWQGTLMEPLAQRRCLVCPSVHSGRVPRGQRAW